MVHRQKHGLLSRLFSPNMGLRSVSSQEKSSDVTYENMIFKTNLWLVRMLHLRLQPSIVGKDVEFPKARKRKFAALAIAADDPVIFETRRLFFESLNRHTRDDFTKEVKFEKHNFVLNISALDQDEVIRLRDPRLLFNGGEVLYTAIQYFGSDKVWRLGPDRVLGSSDEPSNLLDSIEQGFSIEVHLETGESRRQDFQMPGPPIQYRTVFALHSCYTWNYS